MFLDLLDGVLDAAMMLLALAILMALPAVVVLYVIDVTQNSQAIRKTIRHRPTALCVRASLCLSAFSPWTGRAPSIGRNGLGGAGHKSWTAPSPQPDKAAESLRRYLLSQQRLPAYQSGDRGACPTPLTFGEGYVSEPYIAPLFSTFQRCPTARYRASLRRSRREQQSGVCQIPGKVDYPPPPK